MLINWIDNIITTIQNIPEYETFFQNVAIFLITRTAHSLITKQRIILRLRWELILMIQYVDHKSYSTVINSLKRYMLQSIVARIFNVYNFLSVRFGSFGLCTKEPRTIMNYWRHHLCTPPPATGLDIETSYLVSMCTYFPHICTSNSDLYFLYGGHFGTFHWFPVLSIKTVIETSYHIFLSISSLPIN